jgi:HEAT repeat protein
VLAAEALAHGGQYRGPSGPGPGGPGVPSLIPPPGGPSGPGGPTTGGRGAASDPISWQVWWEFNKDPFLQLRTAVMGEPVTSSDDFYLGPRRTVAVRDTLAPSTRDKRSKIVPALAHQLQTERNRDMVTACLVALAKIGLDGDGVVLEDVLQAHLNRDDQEVRETAALALGIAGRKQALPILAALLANDHVGKKLVGQEDVSERTRAFAAYGLGLIAERATDTAVKQQVHDLLAPVLADKETRSRDLRVAVIQALGLLTVRPDNAGDKHLLWQTLPELWEFYERDLGRAEQAVQSHVPIAVARLLGRGNSADHQRSKQRLAAELAPDSRRSAAIRQSAAAALGSMCLPAEICAEDAPYSAALLRTFRDGIDQQARYFALVALGRIGGAKNRADLMAAHDKSNKSIERPWCAMALGLVGRAAVKAGEADAEIGKALLHDLLDIQNDDAQAAFAVGLGLSGWVDAAPHVLDLLAKKERNETLAGYLCISLALLGYTAATDPLADVMTRSLHRPLLLQQSAVALGRLGDKRACERLAAMMKDNDSAAALAAVAGALSYIGDRRSIDPLLALLDDREVTRLGRAFVAAALGGVGDKDPVPWNTRLAVDANYYAAVDTFTNGRSGVLDIL